MFFVDHDCHLVEFWHMSLHFVWDMTRLIVINAISAQQLKYEATISTDYEGYQAVSSLRLIAQGKIL